MCGCMCRNVCACESSACACACACGCACVHVSVCVLVQMHVCFLFSRLITLNAMRSNNQIQNGIFIGIYIILLRKYLCKYELTFDASHDDVWLENTFDQ